MPDSFPPPHTMAVQEQKSLAFAKKGIVLGILSGIIFSFSGVFVELGKSFEPLNTPALYLLVPMLCAGIHDLCAAILTTLYNARCGKLAELQRSLASRPGKYVIAGAAIGAICGMAAYMMALTIIGAAYAMPISSAYPAVGMVLAVLILKEQVRPLAWLGIAGCIAGVVIIGYTPPESTGGSLFYIGLFCAALAAFGWAVESVCAAAGMDFIDPLVALNIYYLVSTLIFWGLLIPSTAAMVLPDAGGWATLWAIANSKGVLFIALAGAFGFLAFTCWYYSICMTGLSRGMALNVSYALWGILFSSIINNTPITSTLVLGAVLIFIGIVLVIGNPKDMLNLRKME